MFVHETMWDDATEAGKELFESERRRVRKARGPASMYALESITLYPHDDDTHLGDIYVEMFREGGRVWLYTHAVVINEPLLVPRSRGKRMVLLRRRIDLEP